MRPAEKFLFLEKEERYYETDTQKTQTVFKFKEGEQRGLIGIPINEDKFFWYKYFVKNDGMSYRTRIPIEELPLWFRELVEKSMDIVEKRDRIRKIFKQNYIEKTKY